jgi:hypothetical protein
MSILFPSVTIGRLFVLACRMFGLEASTQHQGPEAENLACEEYTFTLDARNTKSCHNRKYSRRSTRKRYE